MNFQKLDLIPGIPPEHKSRTQPIVIGLGIPRVSGIPSYRAIGIIAAKANLPLAGCSVFKCLAGLARSARFGGFPNPPVLI